MATIRVLVAEDDDELRSLVAESLTADGMTVEAVGSGGQLLSKLAEGGVDLLVTDVMMPELGGMQAAAMARTAGEEIPILVMTGRRDAWIDESVRKLQCADVLFKPFSQQELVERARALLSRYHPRLVEPLPAKNQPHVFPPALVPLLRDHVGGAPCLVGVPDDDLVELLGVIFFAGLATEEGERNPVRVVFVGTGPVDIEPAVSGVPSPLFRWSTLQFRSARAFSAHELVKLAAATTDGRVFVQVCHRDGRLLVTGLAREGVNLEDDKALKVVSERPGALSIRLGRRHVLDYEHGLVQSLTTGVMFEGGPVREALELAARRCGLPLLSADRYLELVRLLVARLSAHGAGGILVFALDDHDPLAGESGYRTYADVSLAAMLLRVLDLRARAEAAQPTEREQDLLLAGTLQAEIQRTIVELGALTALDGAVVFDRSLALMGFGIILPVDGADATVVETADAEATAARPFDLRSRGTRHRAAAAYSWHHPGSVVFVASQDGDLGCMFRPPEQDRVVVWRFRAAALRGVP